MPGVKLQKTGGSVPAGSPGCSLQGRTGNGKIQCYLLQHLKQGWIFHSSSEKAGCGSPRPPGPISWAEICSEGSTKSPGLESAFLGSQPS